LFRIREAIRPRPQDPREAIRPRPQDPREAIRPRPQDPRAERIRPYLRHTLNQKKVKQYDK